MHGRHSRVSREWTKQSSAHCYSRSVACLQSQSLDRILYCLRAISVALLTVRLLPGRLASPSSDCPNLRRNRRRVRRLGEPCVPEAMLRVESVSTGARHGCCRCRSEPVEARVPLSLLYGQCLLPEPAFVGPCATRSSRHCHSSVPLTLVSASTWPSPVSSAARLCPSPLSTCAYQAYRRCRQCGDPDRAALSSLAARRPGRPCTRRFCRTAI